jgi:hypothetical protein
MQISLPFIPYDLSNALTHRYNPPVNNTTLGTDYLHTAEEFS